MSAGHHEGLFVEGHSRLHRMAPEAKVAAAVGFVFAVALTPRYAWWSIVIDMVAVVVALALTGFAPSLIARRILAVVPFVLFAFLIPFIADGEQVTVGPLTMSREGLWGTWNIVSKAVIGISVSIALAGTTPVADILTGLGKLRVPSIFTAIAGFMFRYLELIVADLGRMRTAMTSRGYRPQWIWQAKPIAASAGSMFVRSYERGERVHAAMMSRGFTGEMPVLRTHVTPRNDWLLAGAFVATALTAAILGALTT